MEKLLILGIGNYLLGDEGVGVHAIQMLEKLEWPPGIDLVDGGTGGFHLLQYLEEYRQIIMIDATMDDKIPGTITLLEPKYASDFPPSLSAHDVGLKDLVDSASLLGHLPKIYLFAVSVEDISKLSTELSPVVKDCMEEMVGKVVELGISLIENQSAD